MSLAGNKDVVVAFYETLFNDKLPDVAARDHLGDTYIQHNPSTPDGRAGVVAFATDWAQRYPEMRLDIRRVIADGDLVMTHSRLTFVPGGAELALADIWRLEDATDARNQSPIALRSYVNSHRYTSGSADLPVTPRGRGRVDRSRSRERHAGTARPALVDLCGRALRR
jgi:predicted SnoaL-like aldol condensation-catalyzing enzyme